MSTYVYNQSGYTIGKVIGKVESGFVYDLRRGQTEYGKEVIARISNNYVYPSETVGYGVPQFYCKGNILYKGSYSAGTPIYCAENGYIYLYPKSNNQIVAQYRGYASEALLCYVSLRYYKKRNVSESGSGYISTSSSSSQGRPANNDSGGSIASGCAAIIGLPIFAIFLYPLLFFNDHPELFCFVYIIPPAIYLLFAIGSCLFSDGKFKSNVLKAIGGFILGVGQFLIFCFIITIFESFLAGLYGSTAVLLTNQVLSENVKFIIGVILTGVADAILLQCEDK